MREGTVHTVFAAVTDTGPNLGESPEPEVEVLEQPMELQAGDRVVISNAALWQAVKAEDVARITSTLVPPVAARRLVEAAEREGGRRPISVQIVQVGDAVSGMIGVEPNPPRPIREPVVRDVAAPAPVRRTGPSTVRPAPLVDAGVEAPRGGGLDWKWMVAILAVVGLGVFAVQRTMSSDESERYAARSDAPPTVVERETTFWDRVRVRLGDRGRVLDPSEVERWVADDADRQRVLREAKAVVAVLEAPPETPPPIEEPAIAGVEPGGTTESAAGGDEESPEPDEADGGDGSEPVDTPAETEPTPAETEPAAAAEAPTPRVAWDPSTLSPMHKAVDAFFANPDPGEGAKALKDFIRRRHNRAARILRSLTEYLEQAPPERSLRVLTRLLEERPGPKTKRWAKRNIESLRKRLGVPE